MRTTDPLIHLVTRRTYLAHMGAARCQSALIRGSTSPTHELAKYPETETSYFLTPDRKSGFMIHRSTLMGLFSLERGRGASLITIAVNAGARVLECYDGVLPTIYSRHGFTEVSRSANWSEGAPDVILMAHSGD